MSEARKPASPTWGSLRDADAPVLSSTCRSAVSIGRVQVVVAPSHTAPLDRLSGCTRLCCTRVAARSPQYEPARGGLRDRGEQEDQVRCVEVVVQREQVRRSERPSLPAQQLADEPLPHVRARPAQGLVGPRVGLRDQRRQVVLVAEAHDREVLQRQERLPARDVRRLRVRPQLP